MKHDSLMRHNITLLPVAILITGSYQQVLFKMSISEIKCNRASPQLTTGVRFVEATEASCHCSLSSSE